MWAQLGWVWRFGSHKGAIKPLVGCVLIWRFEVKDPVDFPCGCRTERSGHFWLSGRGHAHILEARLISSPCGPSIVTPCFFSVSKKMSLRASASKMECDVASGKREVTSWDPGHAQAQGCIQEGRPEDGGSLGGLLTIYPAQVEPKTSPVCLQLHQTTGRAFLLGRTHCLL